MPIPYGGDRLTTMPGGGHEIRSALDKGWRGKRARTNTTPEFWGTPVLWNDQWFEVTMIRRLADGGRIYVLYPWPEEHAIRNPSQYDAASESARLAEGNRTVARRKASHLIAIAGLVVGHVPAHAQIEIEREYGYSASRLTLISTLIPLWFAAWVATRIPVRNQLGVDTPEVGGSVILLGAFLFLESLVRLMVALSKGSPCGSVAGLIGYEIWRSATRSGRAFEARAAVKAESRLKSKVDREADAATLDRDEYTLREPFLSLLSPEEQLRLRATFGFDPKLWGLRLAVAIGLLGSAGAVTTLMKINRGEATLWTWSSLLAALFIVVEQVRRLTTILDGKPAGSILGALVRPWCRALFVVRPRALQEGSIEPAPIALPDVWQGDEPDDQTGR